MVVPQTTRVPAENVLETYLRFRPSPLSKGRLAYRVSVTYGFSRNLLSRSSRKTFMKSCFPAAFAVVVYSYAKA